MKRADGTEAFEIRSTWLDRTTTELQIAAAATSMVPLFAWERPLQQLVTVLPEPESNAEVFVLRAAIAEFTVRWSRVVHHRLDPEGVLPCDCSAPARLMGLADGRTRHPLPAAVRAVELIHTELRTIHTSATLAERLHVHRRQLEIDFRKRTGLSVREYGKRVRVKTAIERLAGHPDEKIEAVALETGYRSKKNFYRALRSLTVLTPSAVRELSPELAEDIGCISVRSVRLQADQPKVRLKPDTTHY